MGYKAGSYQHLKEDLIRTKEQVKEIEKQLQKRCPHNNITKDEYCNDDWDMHKTYTTTYKCDFCGKSVIYDEDDNLPKSPEFIKMEKLYNKKHGL